MINYRTAAFIVIISLFAIGINLGKGLFEPTNHLLAAPIVPTNIGGALLQTPVQLVPINTPAPTVAPTSTSTPSFITVTPVAPPVVDDEQEAVLTEPEQLTPSPTTTPPPTEPDLPTSTPPPLAPDLEGTPTASPTATEPAPVPELATASPTATVPPQYTYAPTPPANNGAAGNGSTVTLQNALRNEAQRQQAIQFNPDAALQKVIFAHRFVPNSPEFRLSVGSVNYGGQRAESLQSGEVRIYYVVVGEWGDVQYATRGSSGLTQPEQLLITEGERQQAIQFNPAAALQQSIFGDGYVPNSDEFSLAYNGTSYIAQRAENLGTGTVRIYYVRVGDWSNVKYE